MSARSRAERHPLEALILRASTFLHPYDTWSGKAGKLTRDLVNVPGARASVNTLPCRDVDFINVVTMAQVTHHTESEDADYVPTS